MSLIAFRQPEQEIQDTLSRNLTIYEAISALNHFECQQNPQELGEMLDIIRDKTSLLEIGCNFGGTLWRMGNVLRPKSKIVALDMVEQKHALLDPMLSLKYNCHRLQELGHEVHLIEGDSHLHDNRAKAEQHAPYDFIFIDGDHSYDGVKRDWLDYGPMGKVVGFHDVSGGTEGCVRFWKELKAQNKYRTVEFDHPRQLPHTRDWLKLGIGIVFRES